MKFLLQAMFLTCACFAISPAWAASGMFDPDHVMVDNTRMGDAEEMLQQWLSGHPEDEEAKFLLARILFWQKKFQDARVQYDRLLERHPENPDYLAGRAMLPKMACEGTGTRPPDFPDCPPGNTAPP